MQIYRTSWLKQKRSWLIRVFGICQIRISTKTLTNPFWGSPWFFCFSHGGCRGKILNQGTTNSLSKNKSTIFIYRLFQITKLMPSSFILQQYVCYITNLKMFRAAPCSSSGGQIVLLQPLVSSLSVNSRTVCR